MLSTASSGSPRISNSTSAACPLAADLIGVVRVERRLDVLDLAERLEPADDVFDHGRERGVVDRD